MSSTVYEDERITSGMKEYHFYKPGMTLEEWYSEREHLGKHIDEWHNGTYIPLWKQKESSLHLPSD